MTLLLEDSGTDSTGRFNSTHLYSTSYIAPLYLPLLNQKMIAQLKQPPMNTQEYLELGSAQKLEHIINHQLTKGNIYPNQLTYPTHG